MTTDVRASLGDPAHGPVQAQEIPALLNLLDARSGGAASLDPLGRIRWVTPSFRRFLVEPTEALTGRDIREFLGASELNRFQLSWQEASQKNTSETHLSFGRTDRHRVGVTLVRATNGMLMVLEAPRLTKPEEKAREDEVDRLRELNQLRVHFINTAAHEFATPLTPLRLQTAMLKNESLGPLTERQRQCVEVIERNMERLSQLVQDVLDVSRLEAGRLRLDVTSVDLSLIVQQAVASVQPQAQKAGVDLVAEVAPQLELLGDSDRLTQVMFNLLTNALKFTPRGGRITVRTIAGDDSVTVSVEDTGAGIPAEKMGRLFQPFSQLHDARQPTRAGSGLGLSISHGIITQHGGRIWVESRGANQGSKFSFSLPWTGSHDNVKGLKGAHRVTRIDRRGTWNLFYFKCPECGSRDIDIKLLKNQYDCNQCRYAWR